MKGRAKRGLTIEYVLVMMALVAAFIVLVLTTVSLTSERAGAYREYIERAKRPIWRRSFRITGKTCSG